MRETDARALFAELSKVVAARQPTDPTPPLPTVTLTLSGSWTPSYNGSPIWRVSAHALRFDHGLIEAFIKTAESFGLEMSLDGQGVTFGYRRPRSP